MPHTGSLCTVSFLSQPSPSGILLLSFGVSQLHGRGVRSAVTAVLINALEHACVPGVCGVLSFPAPPLAAVLGSALNSALSPQNRFSPPPVPFPQLQGVLPDILKPAVLPFPQVNAFVLLGEVSCSPCRATAPPSKILQFFLIYSENAQWGSWRKSLQKC